MVYQLMADYERIKTRVEDLQETYKRLADFDWSSLQYNSWEDFKTAEGALGPVYKLMSQANGVMNLVNDFESLVNDKNIKIGNNSVSIWDIFANDGVEQMILSSGEFMIVEPWANRTPEQKAVFYSKYNMNPNNYMRYNQIRESMIDLTMYSVAFDKALEESIREQKKTMNELTVDLTKNADGSFLAAKQAAVVMADAEIAAIKEGNTLAAKLALALSLEIKAEQLRIEESNKKKEFSTLDGIGMYNSIVNSVQKKQNKKMNSKKAQLK